VAHHWLGQREIGLGGQDGVCAADEEARCHQLAWPAAWSSGLPKPQR
jgi:hypothetical protein